MNKVLVAPRTQTPLTIIGGYLGAGKTTLLNRLIANPTTPRLAVVVNDFGSLNIDEKLIVSHEGNTISLSNGCVCCSLSDDLGEGLAAILLLKNKPEHIVLEASGVAVPERIAQHGLLNPDIRLAAVITVVDVEHVQQQVRDKYVGPLVRDQLQGADLIVLNKVDLVSHSRCTEVRKWLNYMVESPRILSAVQGHLPVQVILGEGDFSTTARSVDYDRNVFSSWSYESDQLFDVEKLRQLLASLPPYIVRVKGFLKSSEGIWIVHFSGGRIGIEIAPLEFSSDKTQIVFIAATKTLAANHLQQSLERCSLGHADKRRVSRGA